MEKGKVKKVVNLCFLLLIGFIYLIFTSTVPLSVTEGLVIAKLACEILSIVLGIGGGFLIYNNIHSVLFTKYYCLNSHLQLELICSLFSNTFRVFYILIVLILIMIIYLQPNLL